MIPSLFPATAREQPSAKKGKRIHFWWGDRAASQTMERRASRPSTRVPTTGNVAGRGRPPLSTSNLFLCRRRILRSGRRRGRRGGCRWLRLRLRRFHSRKYGRGPGSPRRKNRKRDRRDHENDRGPSRRPGKNRSRAPRTKRCLAALTAESCSQVAALSALQQNDRDQKEADDNVNGCDQICDPHEQNSNGAEAQISTIFSVPESIRWCGRGDLNYSIALITRNLLILLWAKGPQSRFHCTFIVRRTC